WSIAASSSTDRSSTPVPASSRTSSSIRNEVVRARAPMPPLHPRTRTFMEGFPGVPRRLRGFGHRHGGNPLDNGLAGHLRHEDPDRLGATRDGGAGQLEEPVLAAAPGGPLADDDRDLVLPGQALEARGEVHRVADDSVGAPQRRPHVADAHDTGIDAD